ncbi:MAG TPA: PAS domain S-box protein, partial [Opitutus sp.]|nr:PAS domain S-box protein [Opitutus sp.]
MNSRTTPGPARILVIDDTTSIHEDFRKILRRAAPTASALLDAHASLFGDKMPPPPDLGFEIDCASQGQEGLALLQGALAENRPYALAFVDVRMPPGWDGVETIRHLWAADPTLQVVICTAYSDHSWEETVRQLGHGDSLLILKKPFDTIEALQLANALTKKWAIARRDRELLADLDERVRQRTAELRSSEERFAKIFHANPVPTTLQHRDDGRYLDANPAFLQLIGHSRAAVLGRTPAELGLWPASDLWTEALQSIDARTPLRSHRAQLCQRDGTLREVLVSVEQADFATQRCVLTSLEDITDRALLEQQFRQAQKMEAVGQLAAGVAHDFNNLLTVVQAYSGFVLEEATLSEEHRNGLTQVRAAAERAAALTRQLLVFSRRQLAQPEPLDLTITFASLREMHARLLPAEIKVEWNCESDIPRVNAD